MHIEVIAPATKSSRQNRNTNFSTSARADDSDFRLRGKPRWATTVKVCSAFQLEASALMRSLYGWLGPTWIICHEIAAKAAVLNWPSEDWLARMELFHQARRVMPPNNKKSDLPPAPRSSTTRWVPPVALR